MSSPPSSPDTVKRAVTHLRAHIQAGHREKAMHFAEEFVRRYPEEVEAWWWYAIAHSKSDLEKTAAALERVLTLRPDLTEAQEKLARVRQRIPANPPNLDDTQPIAARHAAASTEADPAQAETLLSIAPVQPGSEAVEIEKQASTDESSDRISLLGSLVGVPACGAAGAYIVATVAVAEVIIGTVIFFLHGVFNLFSGIDPLAGIVTFFGLFVVLLLGVFYGVLAAIGGAVLGGIAGLIIGLVNTAITIILGLIAPSLALLVTAIAGAVMAVYLYDTYAYLRIVDLAENFYVRGLADINYVLVAIVGLFVGMVPMGLGMGMGGKAAETTEEAPAAVDSKKGESSKDLANTLGAPWRLYGKLSRGASSVGMTGLGFAGQFIATSVQDSSVEDFKQADDKPFKEQQKKWEKEEQKKRRKEEQELTKAVRNWQRSQRGKKSW